ncbi:hypothetical protein D3C77_461290 [compost metagenome]
MQFGDDFQVAGQHPQLGGGAQFQFAALVDIERLVGTVGLHPHPRTVGSAFEQGKAVAHLGSGGRRQQAFAKQPDLLGNGRIGEVLEVLADLSLQVGLQGAGGRQIKTVQVIQRPRQGQRQPAAGDADAFVGNDRLDGRLCYPVAVDRLAGQCGVGQGAVDDIAGGQHSNVAVGQLGQFVAALGQEVRRTALGNHQRQHLAQGQAACGHAFWISLG